MNIEFETDFDDDTDNAKSVLNLVDKIDVPCFVIIGVGNDILQAHNILFEEQSPFFKLELVDILNKTSKKMCQSETK